MTLLQAKREHGRRQRGAGYRENYVSLPQSLRTAPSFQAENGEGGEGKAASRSAVPPLPRLAEVPDTLAGHTAPR